MSWSEKKDRRERYALTRRARHHKSPVIMSFLRRDVAKLYGWNCYLCGVLLDENTATLDHVFPLKLGGWHCLDNARLACMPCNSRKGNKLLKDFFCFIKLRK